MTEQRLALIDAIDQTLRDIEMGETKATLLDDLDRVKGVLRDLGIRDIYIHSMSYGKLISLALEKTKDD